MVDADEITGRIRFLCTAANGRATGSDCSYVQLSAQRWHEHWALFASNLGQPWQ